MDSKIYNTLNQLCNRLATLENKVNKGITVEGSNSSEILKLGDTLRFNSSGGLQSIVSPGSVNVSLETLNIAHCAYSDYQNPACGVQGALGMPEPDTLVSFGQADALWFNQHDKKLWLFLWFDNGELTEPKFLQFFDKVFRSKHKFCLGHYDVFLINDEKGSGFKPGPIFPIVRIDDIYNVIDVTSLELNISLMDRKENIDTLLMGTGKTASDFWTNYNNEIVYKHNDKGIPMLPNASCKDLAQLYGQDPANCT